MLVQDSETANIAFPTLKESWGILFLLLTVAVAAAVFVLLLTFAFSSSAHKVIGSPWMMPVLYSVQFSVILAVALRLKRRREPGFRVRFESFGAHEGVLIFIVTVGLYFLIDPLTDLLPMPEWFKRIMVDLLGRRDLPTALMLVAAAPLFEELLFRAVVLDGLLKNYSPRRAVIWSAVFFGLGHMNPWQFFSAALLGIFMGWVYYRSGSLLATIFIHALTNGGSFLLSLFFIPDPQQLLTTRQLIGNDPLYVALLALDLLIVWAAVRALDRRWKRPTPAELQAS